MLSIEDCIALSQLTEEEIDAIAEHEHLPVIVAAELGNYLCQSEDGQHYIRDMIEDDIHAAESHGNLARALSLKMVLRHFLITHAGCTDKLVPNLSRVDIKVRRFLSERERH